MAQLRGQKSTDREGLRGQKKPYAKGYRHSSANENARVTSHKKRQAILLTRGDGAHHVFLEGERSVRGCDVHRQSRVSQIFSIKRFF